MRNVLLLLLLMLRISVFSQEDTWQWWNQEHGWDWGEPGWRNWVIFAPGNLGPNALPVPEMKRGILPEAGEIKSTFSSHFHPGDPTQDLSFHLTVPFDGGKVAVEAYGVVAEYYHYDEEIRNRRFSRDVDGKGLAWGDFYFSTLIQICKERAFPNTLLRLACKTASGDLFAARYTDSPGYFMDLSSSKRFRSGKSGSLRPFGSLGFYSWQTNDEATLQNDALMYGIGIDWYNDHFLVSGNVSSYSGYMTGPYKGRMIDFSEKFRDIVIRDRPVTATFESRVDWDRTAAEVRIVHGLRDWDYTTLCFSFIWKFHAL